MPKVNDSVHAYENVLAWGSDIEEGTLQQAAMTARLPIIAGHLALMPDAHVGKGATVGSVIATNQAIIPAAVGVDIGCGMIAVETTLDSNALPDSLEGLLSDIERVVPAGKGQGHETRGDWFDLPKILRNEPSSMDVKLFNTARKQFGSLGSGNHFVEVCLDERDVVWVVLHSGSRGVGNKLAQIHIDKSKALMEALEIHLEDPDLAYLTEGTPEFQAYIEAMLWSQDYAKLNRDAMMRAVLPELAKRCGLDDSADVNGWPVINCHHNFTQQERHNGKPVWLTRKGAIQADVGDRGVIPGSMGTRSYIVTGLGNALSYNSCSHGAGRRLSRGRAKRELSMESFHEAMVGKTWQSGNAENLLDEHPASYKDIDQVMADQADLVSIDHTLHQVLNFKGQ